MMDRIRIPMITMLVLDHSPWLSMVIRMSTMSTLVRVIFLAYISTRPLSSFGSIRCAVDCESLRMLLGNTVMGLSPHRRVP